MEILCRKNALPWGEKNLIENGNYQTPIWRSPQIYQWQNQMKFTIFAAIGKARGIQSPSLPEQHCLGHLHASHDVERNVKQLNKEIWRTQPPKNKRLLFVRSPYDRTCWGVVKQVFFFFCHHKFFISWISISCIFHLSNEKTFGKCKS